jgi:GT2 family glycosyltransferase
MSTPSVSLLMPNRDNEQILELVLERLLEHTTYPNFELIVIDDASTDGSLSILRRWRDDGRFRNFTLLEREHSGVAASLNAGVEVASGELLVQMDGDASVESPGWLERMVDLHQSDERIGVVTPLVTFERSGRIHAAGINIVSEAGLHDRGTTPKEPAGERTFHSIVERMTPEEAGSLVTEVAEVDTSLGVHMLFSREILEELGGYDEGFTPVWFEDLDLALSARRLGYKVFFVDGVHIVHRPNLRGDRTAHSAGRRMAKRLRSGVARAVPPSLRRKVRDSEQKNTTYRPHELRRVRHHYEYWREKWGFDLMNPDMETVLERYGDTEVCWAYDPARRAVGEDIAAGWKVSLIADAKS